MSTRKIMIVGLGSIGLYVLEILARIPRIGKILATDFDEDRGVRITNNAILGAAQQGLFPRIEFVKIDLFNITDTAHMLKDVLPDLIINCTSMLAPRKIREPLPSEIYNRLLMMFGVWLPIHLTLPYKLMQAARKADIDSFVINSSFPDVVNYVLGKVDLSPTIGLGNADLLTPCLQKIIAEKLGVPMRNVSIFLVGSHYLWHHFAYEGTAGGAPYFLKIIVESRDVTNEFDTEKLLSDAYWKIPRPTGPHDSFIRGLHTASSAVRNILAILDDTGEIVNSPGPNGLPGAYPTRLGKKGAEIVLPEEITLKEAIKINEDSNRLDGIESVRDDGTVIFTEKCVKVMKETLKYECKTMKIQETEERAIELKSKFEKLCESNSAA